MLDQLGYRTRLVSGFYANPKHFISHAGEYAILPRDAHVWLELNAGHGFWVPLEPTPGYRVPRYSVGLWYSLKRHATQIVTGLACLLVLAWATYALRAVLLDSLVLVLLPMRGLLSERRQIAWLIWLLDLRCRLAGSPRRVSIAPRQHLLDPKSALPSELQDGIREFFRGADQLYFGSGQSLSVGQRAALDTMCRKLTVNVLRRSKGNVNTRWSAS